MTQPEKLLWALLRDNQLGLHFRRQHALGPYILDFYCASAKLCVEVDGPVHTGQADQDQRRTHWLNNQGIRVLRCTTEQLEQHPALVLATIQQAAAPTTA